MMVPQEITMILSSDPNNGAVNKSSDGSYFEIQLQDGLNLPAEALSATLSVEEATVWWTIPNIITGQNDKMYVTGPLAQTEVKTRIELGYPTAATYSMLVGIQTTTHSLIFHNYASGMPVGDFQVGNKFRPTGGLSDGIEYTIQSITVDSTLSKSYQVSGLLEGNIAANTGDFSRLRSGVLNNFVLTIPQGLYDPNHLNTAILQQLENQGAKTDPHPLISFSPDSPTQKVQMTVNYPNVSIDFTQPDTCRLILGFNNAIYGPYPTAPISFLAENIAKFNQVSYFLIHSDLTNKGIRFNNSYNQTVSQVLIDVAPGSQIVAKPFNPARIPVNELVGAKRSTIRMWLTDDVDRRVNCHGEHWSCRLVIRYLKPYLIGTDILRK
jgi:hypothetical protein